MRTQMYRGAGTQIAKMPELQVPLDQGAAKVRAAAVRLASLHVRTGHYASTLQVATIRGKRGVLDRMVYSDDPAAHLIEWGYEKVNEDGGTTHVRGLHILARAKSAAEAGS